MTLNNSGWILASDHQLTSPNTFYTSYKKAVANQGQSVDISLEEVKECYKQVKEIKHHIENVKTFREIHAKNRQPVGTEAIDDITDIAFYRKGLEKVFKFSDLQGKARWIAELSIRLRNAWNHANSVLAGDIPPPGVETQNSVLSHEKVSFDPSIHLGVPSNAKLQRIGLSGRIVE